MMMHDHDDDEGHSGGCCGGGARRPLDAGEAREFLGDVPGWELGADAAYIHREWRFKNFAQAIEFVNKVGELAEVENHHPDISFGWGYARLVLTTHDIGGLQRGDFAMAKKINGVA